MLPTEHFSGDATQGPPWTPPVWSRGPSGLIMDAKRSLMQDFNHITNSVLGGGDRAMSGSNTAPQNESDEMLPSGDTGMARSDQWQSDLQDLRRTEPLAAWSTGSYDGGGQANPGNPNA